MYLDAIISNVPPNEGDTPLALTDPLIVTLPASLVCAYAALASVVEPQRTRKRIYDDIFVVSAKFAVVPPTG